MSLTQTSILFMIAFVIGLLGATLHGFNKYDPSKIKTFNYFNWFPIIYAFYITAGILAILSIIVSTIIFASNL